MRSAVYSAPHIPPTVHQGTAGLLAPTLRRRFGFGVCWIGGLFGTGISLVAIALASGVVMSALFFVMFMFVESVMGVTNMSLRQEITPDHLLGRVTAAFWTLTGVAAPIGAAVSTFLAAVFGAPPILFGMGLITAVLAMVSVFTPIRYRRPELLYAQEHVAPVTGAALAG
jgi:MFS family permease